MRLTYKDFFRIVDNEKVSIDDEQEVDDVSVGVMTPLGPEWVSLVTYVPRHVYDAMMGLPAESAGPREVVGGEELPGDLDPDDLVEYSFEFCPETFEGVLIGPNVMQVSDDSGTILTLYVYHEIPVNIVAAYGITGT